MKNKLISLILIFILLFNSAACDPIYSYQGDRWDLFTVALNSLYYPNGSIFRMNPDEYKVKKGPIIEVIETDSYGRTLFTYSEPRVFLVHALLVCQKTEEDKVYFYMDNNYYLKNSLSFTDEEIFTLKALNDWDKPFNETKMQSNTIIRERIDVYNHEEILSIYYEIAKYLPEEKYTFSYLTGHLVTEDAYGRQLYYFIENYNVDDVERIQKKVLIMNDPTLSLCENSFIVIDEEDVILNQQAMKDFKIANNWNQPIN